MPDLRFYNTPDQQRGPFGRVFGTARRLLRRVLRPIFERQVEIYGDIYTRADNQHRLLGQQGIILHRVEERVADLFQRADSIDRDVESVRELIGELERYLKCVQAFAWDYTAMTRRLTQIEEHLIAISGEGNYPVPLDQHGSPGLPITQLTDLSDKSNDLAG